MFRPFLPGLLLALGSAPSLLAQEPDDVARRIAAAASIAVDEYAEGVSNGAIVLPEEYDEARLFLTEAPPARRRPPGRGR